MFNNTQTKLEITIGVAFDGSPHENIKDPDSYSNINLSSSQLIIFKETDAGKTTFFVYYWMVQSDILVQT